MSPVPDPDRRDARSRPTAVLALAAAVLAAALAVTFADVLFAGRTLSAASYVPGVLPGGPVGATQPPAAPHLRDVEGAAWVDEPGPYLVHRALAAGELPLWNPDEGLGAPLAANLNAAAFALTALPVNLRPSPAMQDFAWILRAWLLGIATCALARGLGASPPGAIAAGLAITLSGQTLDWIAHHPLNTDAFVPLALLAAVGVVEGRRGAAAWLALAVMAALLGGKPQSALVAGLCGGVWVVAAGIDLRRRTRGTATAKAAREATGDAIGGAEGASAPGPIAPGPAATEAPPAAAPALGARLAVVAGAALLGVALAGVALVPFVETWRQASGLVHAGRSTQGASSLPLAGLPGLIAPWALAAAAGREFFGALPPSVASLPPTLPHAGAVALLLAAIGFAHARRRVLGWALAATIAFYVAKLFAGWPAGLGDLPLLRAVSFVKYCFPLYLAIALLAGSGVDAIASWTRPRRWVAAAVVAILAVELVALGAREHPVRLDPYRPAPYVDALRALEAERPGRVAGPVDLMPPLVSNALGFADLRAIDVLTPGATWDFFTRLVAPSQGLTWILADPDPLLVATSPGADLADTRWILAREPLRRDALPDAVRSHVSARRTTRLFDTLDRYAVDTRRLWAGITAFGGDRRFHWTCTTPCRWTLEFAELPPLLAIGLGANGPVDLAVTTAHPIAPRGAGPAAESPARESESTRVALGPDADGWRDLFVDLGAAAGRPGVVRIVLEAREPSTVFIGGLGPSPGEAAEAGAVQRELAARRRAFDGLALRHADDVAHVYENPRALGRAWFATRTGVAATRDEVLAGLTTAQGEAVAVAAATDLHGGAWPALSSGSVVVASEGSNGLDLETESATGGVLVVARLADPGWAAAIDGGDRLPIVPVNGALIGVPVPPGAHRVALRYRPRSFAAGAGLSAVAALALTAIVLRERRRGWRRSRP